MSGNQELKNKTRLIAQTGLKYVVTLQYISTSLESKNKNDDDVLCYFSLRCKSKIIFYTIEKI